MGSPANPTNYDVLSRELWPQKSIYELILQKSPTVGILRKDTSLYEKTRHIVVGYGTSQGLGYSDFAEAKAAKGASPAESFAISPKSVYGTFSLDGLLMRRAKSDKAVIVDPMKRESKNLMHAWVRDLARNIHGNGGGAIARLTAAATITTTLLQVRTASDLRGIENGMRLQSATTDGTSGSVKSGHVVVASVYRDPSTPTIVCAAEANVGIPNIAVSDYLFRKSAFGNAVSGFDAWNPEWSVSSLPGTFKGANRNLDPERLAGHNLDARTLTPRLAALRAARLVHEAGGSPDTYILSTTDWENLANELQSAGMLKYSTVPSQGIGKFNFGIKYDAIQIMGPAGPIDCIADADAPVGVGRMFQRDAFVLASMGELVHWIEGAGPSAGMMEDAADSTEFRLVGDFELYCEAPGYVCRVKLA